MPQPLVFPVAQQLTLINAIVALAAYVGAKLHLYSNNFVPSEDNVLADFTEVIATGYVAEALTWSAGFIDINGNAVSSPGEKIFTAGGIVTDMCYGVYITDAASAVLLASGPIDGAPFGFPAGGATLPLTVKLAANGGLTAISPVP
jgi:hypothetical protein